MTSTCHTDAMEDDFIDFRNAQRGVERAEHRIKTSTKLTPNNKKIILRYMLESRLGKTIKKGQKRKIKPQRVIQSAYFLERMTLEWFKKDLDKVNIHDMDWRLEI